MMRRSEGMKTVRIAMRNMQTGGCAQSATTPTLASTLTMFRFRTKLILPLHTTAADLIHMKQNQSHHMQRHLSQSIMRLKRRLAMPPQKCSARRQCHANGTTSYHTCVP